MATEPLPGKYSHPSLEYLRDELIRLKQSRQKRQSVKRFASVEHLNPEAIAAYVDEELSPAAFHRARTHLVHCQECREEVIRQRVAAQRLRACKEADVQVSHALLTKLTQIATTCCDDPEPERAQPIHKRFEEVKQIVGRLRGLQ